MAILPTLVASRTFPKSGPFPPPALPGFVGTMGLSDSPAGPACPSRASGWLTPPPGVSRVADDLLGQTCRRLYPGGTAAGIVRSPSLRQRPSPITGRVGSHNTWFRGLDGVHFSYGLPARRAALRPFAPEASTSRLPYSPLRLLPAGATVAGWDLHPLKIAAFSAAHPLSPFLIGRPVE
jgi:hypothetical protein